MASRSNTNSIVRQLLEAAFTGNLRDLKILVAGLDDGNGEVGRLVAGIKDKNGLSALHFAACEGKLDVCKYLIDDLKFDVDARDGKGDTPLHHASLRARLSTALYFLEKGANPDVVNSSGFTPLHYVAYEGHMEILQLLLPRGVNVDAISEFGTPLNRAAGEGKHEVIKILLDHHANPNIYFHRCFTPLSSSIIAGSLACLKLLIEAGADPNAGSCDVIPLILAADEGETKMMETLLKAGADPNVTNEYGMTPIEIAALKGNLEDVQILYPLTSPISTFPDWSIGGIMGHIQSEEAREQRALKEMEKSEEMKEKGKDAFRKKDYLTAVLWFTRAHEAEPFNAIILSNRSLCWACLKEGDRALSDAEGCVALNPEWSKAYYRKGAACMILEKFGEAVEAFSKGLSLNPANTELQNAFQKAVKAMS